MTSNYEERFKQLVNEVYDLKGKPEGRELKALLNENFERLAQSTFYHWIAGSHASYDIRKLRTLASMRGWSIAQTVAFLYGTTEGGGNSLKKFDPFSLRSATMPEVLQTLEVCSDILSSAYVASLGKSSLTPPNLASTNMSNLNVLRQLMQTEQAKRQKNNAQFAETLGVGVEFLEAFYAGQPVLFDDLIINSVAQGLPDPSGVYGNWRYIYSLLSPDNGSNETVDDREHSNGHAI